MVLVSLLLTQVRLQGLETVNIDVLGQSRQFLVSKQPGGEPAPLLIFFHGHGGTMQNGARRYGYEKKWSEAVVMYPQGLPTVTRRDPEGKRSGWNSMAVGRDVRFVEDMLKWVKSNRKIGKVFIAGHSNGGGFVYGLWRAMPKEFSGVASYAATGQPSPRIGSIPLFHLSGRKDETVKFDEQVSTVQRLVTQFGSSQDSSPKDGLTTFKGSTHELRWYVHAGGHELPEKGIDLTIEFFKELARK